MSEILIVEENCTDCGRVIPDGEQCYKEYVSIQGDDREVEYRTYLDRDWETINISLIIFYLLL